MKNSQRYNDRSGSTMMNPHKQFSAGWKDERKRELIAFRCDQELFQLLKEEASMEGLPLSETVRELCERGLKA